MCAQGRAWLLVPGWRGCCLSHLSAEQKAQKVCGAVKLKHALMRDLSLQLISTVADRRDPCPLRIGQVSWQGPGGHYGQAYDRQDIPAGQEGFEFGPACCGHRRQKDSFGL